MQIVTGYRGQAHITSNDDQGRNQGVFGQNSYVLSVGSQFAPTLVSANELRIADGEAVMQGVHFRVDPSSFDSVTITNGTQGMNRKDLVVCRYTKDGSTGVENCEWVVIEGTPTSGTAARPSAVSGDILDGALVADMPFFEIVLSGINVTAVNSLFSKLMTMQEIQALAKTNESGISELNSNIGNTTALMNTNITQEGSLNIPNYTNYRGLLVIVRADSNNGVNAFIPKGLYTSIIPLSLNSKNNALVNDGTGYVVSVQGYVQNGVINITSMHISGWTKLTVLAYGVS